MGEIREKPSSTVALSGHFISMKIVGAVLGGGLMTLCLLRPGTAQYIIFAVVDFVVIFNLCIKNILNRDYDYSNNYIIKGIRMAIPTSIP